METPVPLPPTSSPRVLALLSGGLDSTVAVAHYHAAGYLVDTLSIHYGQRHARELDAARAVAETLHLRHDVLSLPVLGQYLSGSALTDMTVTVPDGHYEEASMKQTIVANRNAILIAIATGVASARGAVGVVIAAHAGDHAIYPDCRPEFLDAMHTAMCLGTDGVGLLRPFAHKTKADLVTLGVQCGAPLALTWSCYKGGAHHCGTCGTCVERKEAFVLAGVPDPTTYLA